MDLTGGLEWLMTLWGLAQRKQAESISCYNGICLNVCGEPCPGAPGSQTPSFLTRAPPPLAMFVSPFKKPSLSISTAA